MRVNKFSLSKNDGKKNIIAKITSKKKGRLGFIIETSKITSKKKGKNNVEKNII